MPHKVKRIGILTAGGDCPGLNAVIRGVVKSASFEHGMEVVGIEDGFGGLLAGKTRALALGDTTGILALGGTVLGASSVDNPFRVPAGEGRFEDRSDEAIRACGTLRLDALLCVGGDGTMHMAHAFAQKGLHVIGVPKTIDNDLDGTDQTFGFDTAAGIVSNAVVDLHATAQAHHRVMIVETMGRYAGWLALVGGLGGGADVILIPEIPYKLESVLGALEKRRRLGKRFSIVAVAEGAKPEGGELVVKDVDPKSTDPIRLGGIAAALRRALESAGGPECRTVVLGHLQRAGRPSTFDRVFATRLAVHAVGMAARREFGRMASLRRGEIADVPLADTVRQLRLVPPYGEICRAARSIGTAFGE